MTETNVRLGLKYRRASSNSKGSLDIGGKLIGTPGHVNAGPLLTAKTAEAIPELPQIAKMIYVRAGEGARNVTLTLFKP
jgi:hypothetical protein